MKTQKTNRRGSSVKKPKKAGIEVHQAQPQVIDTSDVDDVPDVEYAPPKPKGKPNFDLRKSPPCYVLTLRKQIYLTIQKKLPTTPHIPSSKDAI